MSAFQSSRGDTWTLKVQVTQLPDGAPDGAFGVPVNITGYKIYFTVKRYITDPDAYAVFQSNSADLTNNVTITDALNGKVTCKMPSSKTVNFPDGQVVLLYDVAVIDLAGNVSTVDSGTVTIVPDVTRAVS